MKRTFFFITGMAVALGCCTYATATGPGLQRWEAGKANEWCAQHPWFAGFNYVPSTACNTTEFWGADTFDAPTITRELGWARDLGFTSCRVFIQYLVWKDDPEGFKNRFRQFLSIATENGISVVPTLFDDCSFGDPRLTEPFLGKQRDPIPGMVLPSWTPSPGLSVVTDQTKWPDLQRYVADMTTTFAKDRRILFWDLYNEPGNSGMGDTSLPLVEAVFDWARKGNPQQPLTVAVWCGMENLNRAIVERSDIISYHAYTDFNGMKTAIAAHRQHGRPVICSEWMSRHLGSRWDTDLPLFKEEGVSCYSWGLVNGRTQAQFSWSSKKGDPEPAVWFHDLFHADGTPYDPKELEVIKRVCAKEQANANPSQPAVPLVQRPMPIHDIEQVGGFVGERMRLNRDNYLKTFDVNGHVAMVEDKKHRDWWWIGEQPGKWLESAVLNAEWCGDGKLKDGAWDVLTRIAAAQEPNGYVGITDPAVRAPEKPLRGMDPYELYFMLHGLLTAHEELGSSAALQTARRLGDYFAATIGPGKAEFWPGSLRHPDNRGKTLDGQSAIAGHSAHYCWEGTLLIDPMLRLHEITGDQRYLDWCRWVISSIDRWGGWDAFSKLDQVAAGTLGIHEVQPYVHSHTFQMNFLGFLRMYQATGDVSYLKKVEGAWADVAKRQMYITGGVSVGEHYEKGYIKPVTGHVVETCATMSWLQLTQYLLELTGDPKYADAMERLIVNHVFAAQTIDGDCSRYHTPPNGDKSDYFHGPDCCTGSGHRVISMLPRFFYAMEPDGVVVNQYVPSGVKVSQWNTEIIQKTRYPEEEKILIRVNPREAVSFALKLRIPAWCDQPQVSVNGEVQADVERGKYFAIRRTWQEGDTVEVHLPMRVAWLQHENCTESRIVRLAGGEEMRVEEPVKSVPHALTRGPVVYTFDSAWQKLAHPDAPVVDAAQVKVDLDRAGTPAAVAAPERALGPALETELVAADGKPFKAVMVPFANIGRWYADEKDRPEKNSKTFTYATWLPAAGGR